ncbi:F-box only protein 36-like [Acipenser oxyrinchus oxyrinchus]|uniref:F-box only protein 36-like n=1 Tax=Acipenser oxyrinchus oxyrinchus TaxID=40147 RepID=A0AAD8G6Y3_ACIOX|nr:F-box only protein 36-like [Acipenser oxyrinchus oxyrinchus]
MASLLKEDKLYEFSQQAPSPCKDFYQLLVTKKEVVWRVWKVSNPYKRERAQPGEERKSHNDFLVDDHLQGHIKTVFGSEMLAYVMNLCQQRIDYLVRLPKSLATHILSFLEWEDIKSMSKTCKRFQQLCSSDGLWECAERSHCSSGSLMIEGVSSAIQKKLLIFHRRHALLNQARQQRRMSTKALN